MFGQLDASGRLINGAPLVIQAFDKAFGFGRYIVTIGMILFAYSTVIAWSYYGEKCFTYIFGEKSVVFYRALFALMLIPGALCGIDIVWPFADIMNAALVLPNIVVLLALSRVVKRETDDFLQLAEKEKKSAQEAALVA